MAHEIDRGIPDRVFRPDDGQGIQRADALTDGFLPIRLLGRSSRRELPDLSRLEHKKAAHNRADLTCEVSTRSASPMSDEPTTAEISKRFCLSVVV